MKDGKVKETEFGTCVRGRFFAFEGIDGSGKTTQMHLLANRIRDLGVTVAETQEPTDSRIGSIIRQHMKHELHLNEETIAALFVADRLDHVLDSKIGMRTQYLRGDTVLTDRYYLSSYAYHSRYVDMKWVIDANSLAAKLLKPDLTVFIDIAPEVCITRLALRGSRERYEEIEQLTAVQKQYHLAIEQLAGEENVFIVDGTLPEPLIAEKIWKAVQGFYRDLR